VRPDSIWNYNLDSSSDTTNLPLIDGAYEVSISATDSLGNTSTDTSRLELFVDGAPLSASVDIIHTPFTSPALTGTVNDISATIEVTVDTIGPIAALNNRNGTWQIANNKIQPPLPEGVYSVKVKVWGYPAKDSLQDSTQHISPNALTIDYTPPIVTVDTLITDYKKPQLTGKILDPTATVLVTIVGGNNTNVPAINNGNGTWTIPQDFLENALTPGTYNVKATATDQAGNVGKDNKTWELKIVP